MNQPSEFDMTAWLGHLGLAELAPVFEQNHINRETLAELTNEDLKDCGVSSLGHRKKLLAAILELTAASPAEPAISAPVEIIEAAAPPPAEAPPAASQEPEAVSLKLASPAPVAAASPAPEPVPALFQAAPAKKHPTLVAAPMTSGLSISTELHQRQDAQQAVLRRQQRISLITSTVIALLSIILIMVILALFVLPALLMEAPQVVVYESNTPQEETLENKKLSTRVQTKPSRPASSMAQVITANVTSPTAVPVPDIAVTTPSMEFGDAEDFGDGWGDGDGSGSGMSFFGIKTTPKAVVFVFDISGSMVVKPKNPKTYEVLEEEITKSISMLPSDARFGLVGFSKGANAYKSALVTSILSERNAANSWLKSMSPVPGLKDKDNFRTYKGGRHSGTRADLGLEAAMKLRPDTIIFVSDGEPTDAKGKSSRAYEKEILKKVAAMQMKQSQKVKINAVAYMAGGGLNFMRDLAKQNDGDFREIRPKDVK